MTLDKNILTKIRYDIDHFIFDNVKLYDEILSKIDIEACGELYLLRAQLKLLLGDSSMLEDCIEAQKLLPKSVQYESLFATMEFKFNNCFICFCTNKARFQKQLSVIDQLQPMLENLTGIYGTYFCAQIKGEILYYCGKYQEAISIIEPSYLYFKNQHDSIHAMLAGHVLLRCYLAQGYHEKARRIVSSLFLWSKEGNNQMSIYQSIRMWLNLTTGWSGDNPRYHITPDGATIPFLEDRILAIRKGMSKPHPDENALIQLSQNWQYQNYSMVNYYVQIYHIVVSYYSSLQTIHELALPEILSIAHNTGIVQPIIEYGAHIIPLLTDAFKEQLYDKVYLTDIIHQANKYEKCLCQYREET